jgi:hypothetical protein
VRLLRTLLTGLGIGRVDADPDADPDAHRVGGARLDSTDAGAAAHSRHANPTEWGGEGGGLPPNYVKSYDEGRQRK